MMKALALGWGIACFVIAGLVAGGVVSGQLSYDGITIVFMEFVAAGMILVVLHGLFKEGK